MLIINIQSLFLIIFFSKFYIFIRLRNDLQCFPEYILRELASSSDFVHWKKNFYFFSSIFLCAIVRSKAEITNLIFFYIFLILACLYLNHESLIVEMVYFRFVMIFCDFLQFKIFCIQNKTQKITKNQYKMKINHLNY